MQFRDTKPGRFKLLNFETSIQKGFGRGIVAVFDVQFMEIGATICNLTLEHNRDDELVLGYVRTKIRKRLPKDRQEFKLALTPEFEREIFTEANYELPRARRREAAKQASLPKGYVSPVDGLTLPVDGETEGADNE